MILAPLPSPRPPGSSIADGHSLDWHIVPVPACFGVGLPALVESVEWRGRHTGGPTSRLLACRWASVCSLTPS